MVVGVDRYAVSTIPGRKVPPNIQSKIMPRGVTISMADVLNGRLGSCLTGTSNGMEEIPQPGLERSYSQCICVVISMYSFFSLIDNNLQFYFHK